MPSSVSLQMSLIYIHKVKSATLQKLLMGNSQTIKLTETEVNIVASYLPWVNNRTAKARCETGPKSTVKTPGQHKWCHCVVSTVN